MGTFLKECFLQKTNQFDALRLIKFCPNALEIGSELQLICEEKDPSAKGKVVAKTMGEGGTIIGVLSEEDEKDIKKYLEMKWTELYECRICRTDYNADENKRISICIFVKDNNKK